MSFDKHLLFVTCISFLGLYNKVRHIYEIICIIVLSERMRYLQSLVFGFLYSTW